MAINDSGQIVGSYNDSSGRLHGFLDSRGTYTTIDPPGSTYTFCPRAINDSGQIVGYYYDSSGHDARLPLQPRHLHDDRFPRQHLHLSPRTSTPRARSSGITSDSSGHAHGFLDSRGTYTTIDLPGSTSTFPLTSTPQDRSSGLTSTVAATSTASSTAAAPTRRSISQAALPPLASDINASGQIVGVYVRQ